MWTLQLLCCFNNMSNKCAAPTKNQHTIKQIRLPAIKKKDIVLIGHNTLPPPIRNIRLFHFIVWMLMTLLTQQKMLTLCCQSLGPAMGATVHSTAAWLV